MKKLREISKKVSHLSFNCVKGKWFLPNTKALMEPYRLSHSNWAAPQHVAAFGVVVTECNQPDWGFCSRSNWKSLVFREKKRDEREKIEDERCFNSIYTNINVQSFRRRRQRRSHRRSSGRDGAFRAVRFIREYRNLESLWWEEKRDDLRLREMCVFKSQNLSTFVRERDSCWRVVVLSSAMKVQRERKKVCSSERKRTLWRSLSLSPCVFFFFSLLFVFPRRFFLSLFFKSYLKGEEGKKNEEKEGARFCRVLKPYTLNNFFLHI